MWYQNSDKWPWNLRYDLGIDKVSPRQRSTRGILVCYPVTKYCKYLCEAPGCCPDLSKYCMMIVMVYKKKTWNKTVMYDLSIDKLHQRPCSDLRFVVSGSTVVCSYDYLRGHRWRQSCHYDNSRFSVSCESTVAMMSTLSSLMAP